MNGWRLLTDETVQKLNAAYLLVVPHEAVELRNINFPFLTLAKALDRFYWLNTNKVRRHITRLLFRCTKTTFLSKQES